MRQVMRDVYIYGCGEYVLYFASGWAGAGGRGGFSPPIEPSGLQAGGSRSLGTAGACACRYLRVFSTVYGKETTTWQRERKCLLQE